MGAAVLSGVGALLPTDAEMHPPPALTTERGAGSHRSCGAGRGPGSQRTDAPEAPAERSAKPQQQVDAPAPLNWWEQPGWWLGPSRSSHHQEAAQDAPGRAGGAGQVGRPIYVAYVAAHVYVYVYRSCATSICVPCVRVRVCMLMRT